MKAGSNFQLPEVLVTLNLKVKGHSQFLLFHSLSRIGTVYKPVFVSLTILSSMVCVNISMGFFNHLGAPN